MKKIMGFILFLGCLGLGGGIYYLYQHADFTGPVLQYEGDGIYNSSLTSEELLKGVSAQDDQEGDVSDTLIVEQVIENGDHVEVVYVARDGKNNIGKLYLEMAVATPTPIPTPTPTPLPEKKPEPTKAPETPSPAEQARAEEEQKIQQLPEGAPRIYLSDYYIEIPQGEEVDYLSYVERIEDENEDIDALWRGINMDGFVESSVPGYYEVALYVFDSNGYQSNTAVLRVQVTD